MRKLGTITIGQAPRADLTPLLTAALPPDVALEQVGVLDGLTRDEITARYGVKPGRPVLISRLLDGSSVVMDKETVEAGIQTLVDRLEARGCSTILLLCTGKFDHLTTGSAHLVEPQKIIAPTLAALAAGRRVGILVPLPEQVASEAAKWGKLAETTGAGTPLCAAVSPYAGDTEALAAAAKGLADEGADILVTDCMGFVGPHRDAARAASGLPVILSSALMAKLVAEVV